MFKAGLGCLPAILKFVDIDNHCSRDSNSEGRHDNSGYGHDEVDAILAQAVPDLSNPYTFYCPRRDPLCRPQDKGPTTEVKQVLPQAFYYCNV
jgi:hypothetical protein